jgi:hypothetical protein
MWGCAQTGLRLACGSGGDQVFPAGFAYQLQAVAPWGAGAGWNINIE